MELNRAIDGYCERLEPGLWAEPFNAVSNLAFVIAAAVMWQRCRGEGMVGVLCVSLFVIGVMSGLFHTHAVVWTAMADSLSILIFVLIYLYAANRRFLGFGRRAALVATGLFLPYAVALGALFQRLAPWLGGSAGYVPIPLLIFAYAAYLRDRMPHVARGFVLGAVVLIVSIVFRTLDEPLCAHVAAGTHFVWHLLNAVMLGWMIEVYRRAEALQAPVSST